MVISWTHPEKGNKPRHINFFYKALNPNISFLVRYAVTAKPLTAPKIRAERSDFFLYS